MEHPAVAGVSPSARHKALSQDCPDVPALTVFLGLGWNASARMPGDVQAFLGPE